MDVMFSLFGHSIVMLIAWLTGFAFVFGLLARVMPCNPGQPWWRKDSATDLAYYFVMPIATRIVKILFLGAGIFFVFHGQSNETIQDYLKHGYGPLGALPIWLQAAIVFLLSDLILYWTHRLFHGRELWRFHAIHHSSPEVDFLSAWRFHPINTWFTFTLVDVLMLFAGFSPEATACMAGVNMIYSAMVHANLNWTFGAFKYLFASPVFHRWHHTTQEEGLDKNFAPTFPLLDIVFGTFYMPDATLPEHYGITGEPLPQGFVGQMMWPFKKRG